MSNDLDLNLSPIKRPAPAKGRRATNNQGFLDEDNDETMTLGSPLQSRPLSGEFLLDDDITSGGTRSQPPPRGRRTGGWADEASRAKTAKSVRMASDMKGGIGSDDDEGVPMIPDLDDVRDEDMAFQVAEAPSIAVNRYLSCF